MPQPLCALSLLLPSSPDNRASLPRLLQKAFWDGLPGELTFVSLATNSKANNFFSLTVMVEPARAERPLRVETGHLSSRRLVEP